VLPARREESASPRDAAATGVVLGISFPFAEAPPPSLADAVPGAFHGAVPSRAYVGSETCDRLLPSARDLGKWVSATAAAGWGMTLVLPPLPVEAQPRALERAASLSGVPGAEVVVNDWGTVHAARRRFPDLPVVLGRLTHKVLRDPRLAEYFDSPDAPPAARSALCRSGELSPGYRTLMDRYGIRRREVDPYLQPLAEEEWGGRPERLTVHLPYLFVTMGRSCLPGAMHREKPDRFVPGGPCRMECRRHAVEFRLPDPGGKGGGKRLLALGNGFYHSVPPPVVERILALLPSHPQVDRIVLSSLAPGDAPC
jgi:hypothetical protein